MTLPAWLKPEAEIGAPPTAEELYVRTQVAALRALGVPEWQAIEAAAFACHETGTGLKGRGPQGHNHAGLKAKKDVADWHQRRVGFPLRFWRQGGHAASGDSKVVLYAAFGSSATFWECWLERHVGRRAGEKPYAAIYVEAGRLYWAGDEGWVRELALRGYRGPKTQANPGPSVATHRDRVRFVRQVLGRP
jgi:hypothetical protein